MSQQNIAAGAAPVDIRTIEAAKENIQPVKTGRKPEALKRALAEHGGATMRFNKALEDARYNFETEIENYKGNDPLEVFVRYIKWTQESFVEGSPQSGLLELLNRTVNHFINDDKYKNDSRYMDIWLLYCDNIRDPSDAYRALEDRGIGRTNYLFYKSWGRYLENTRRFDEAEAAYQLGADRKAQPEDLMKACQQSFQARMYLRMKKKQENKAQGIEDSDDEQQPASADDRENAGQRRALGSLRGTGSVRTYANEGAGGISALGQKRAAPAPSASGNNSSGLAIFVDDEFSSASADNKRRRLNSAGMSASTGGAGKPTWASLPSENEKHKENQAQASRWTGVQMPQDALAKAGSMRSAAAAGNARPKSDFAIFEDEIDNPEMRPSAGASANPTALKLRMMDGASSAGSAGSRRIADIQSNPMKPLPYKFKVQTEFYEKGTNKPRMNSEGQMEVSAYDRTAVYPGDGKEYSFEEIRAHRRGYTEPWEEPVPQPEPQQQFSAEEPETEDASAAPAQDQEEIGSQQKVVENPVLMSPFIVSKTSSNTPGVLLLSPALGMPEPFSTAAATATPLVESVPAPVESSSSTSPDADQESLLAVFDEMAPPASSHLHQPEEAPVDKENAQQSVTGPIKKAKAPFRERTVILASSAAPQAAAAHQQMTPQSVRRSFIDDEPEPTTTLCMTVHTRAALANFIDMFNSADRSLDASNDAEMTSGLVTSLIQVKNPSSGFAIFEDGKSASSSSAESPSEQQQPFGGFAVFEESSQSSSPASKLNILDEDEVDQENLAPFGSQEGSVLRRSGVAFTPIEDGSVIVDPLSENGPFYEDEEDQENSPQQPQQQQQQQQQRDLLSGFTQPSSSTGFTIFEEAPLPAQSSSTSSITPFESLIDTSPLFKQTKPLSSQPAATNASFAVTPFGNTSRAILATDSDGDDDEDQENNDHDQPQRILDFDNDDLLFSPGTSHNTIANRNIVNSPLSPLSMTRRTTTGGVGADTSQFNLLDNTGQFTISGLQMTSNFDLDTKSILGGHTLTSVLSSSDVQAAASTQLEDDPVASMKTVSFRNSMHTVKIAAQGSKSTVDPYSAMASQLAPMMKELNLGSSSSFVDLSSQLCPEVSTRLGSSIHLGNKSAIVLKELPVAGPVGTKLLEIEISATSNILRVNPKVSAWEFYIARRLAQKLPADKQNLVVSPSSFLLYKDASMVVYPNNYAASVQDLIPLTVSSIMEEYMAAYCAWHLLDISDAIHNQGIIIGNLAARNLFMLNGTLQSVSNFKPGGSEWAYRAPSITDLSKAIDTKSFASATFAPSSMTLPPQLQELVASRETCSFEVDTLAICEIVHSLLFGKPISVEQDMTTGRWRVTSAMKSYWKAPWVAFFDGLLNATGATDVSAMVQNMRSQIEKYFQSNPGKIRSLQSALSNLK